MQCVFLLLFSPVFSPQTNNVDPDMKELFDMVGVKDDTDKETIDFIYDFVNKSGGIEAVREEIKKERPLPPPPPSVSIGFFAVVFIVCKLFYIYGIFCPLGNYLINGLSEFGFRV